MGGGGFFRSGSWDPTFRDAIFRKKQGWEEEKGALRRYSREGRGVPMKDGADIVDLEGAPRPDSEPATPRLSSARIHKTASHLSIRSNARSEASTADGSVPGLAKSTRRPNGRFFTGTGGENTSA